MKEGFSMKDGIARRSVLALASLSVLAFALSAAHAQAIINNSAGEVILGVGLYGDLNIPGGVPSASGITTTGIRYLKPSLPFGT